MSKPKFYFDRYKPKGHADYSGKPLVPSVDADEADVPEHERTSNLHAMRFSAIADRFERAEAPGKSGEKHGLIFDAELRARLGRQSSYPVVRLLLVQFDQGRRNFGLKTKGLAKLYLQLTGLKSASLKNEDAMKLQYHAGAAGARGAFQGAELGETLREVLTPRLAKDPLDPATLGEVHAFLDKLSLASSGHRELFDGVYNRLGPTEHKWLARVIVGNLKMGGIGDKVVFKRLHADAEDRYSECQDLKRVCAEYAVDGPGHREKRGQTITAGASFRPMLAHGESNVDDQASYAVKEVTRTAKRRGLAHEPAPFSAEVKLDGERIMAHFYEAGAGFACFTRAGTNYTEHYGAGLGPPLRVACSGLDSCVLDGECMGVDLRTGECIRFGSNQTIARVEKALVAAGLADSTDDDAVADCLEVLKIDGTFETEDVMHARLVYVVFDVLVLEGSGPVVEALLGTDDAGEPVPPGQLGHLPLRLRREIAARIVARSPRAGEPTARVRFVEKVDVDVDVPAAERTQRLHAFYEGVVRRGGEGVVVKHLDAPYYLGEKGRRLRLWIKLKPEYGGDGEIPRLDVVIVGANWSDAATGGRKGQLSQFSVAVYDPRTGLYHAAGRVGTGYGFAKVKDINEKLRDNLEPYDRGNRPAWLAKYWNPKTDNRPDRIIKDIAKSVVLEIKCAELPTSQEYPDVGYTFRFPRVERIRDDKACDDICTLDQMRAVARAPRVVTAKPGASSKSRKRKAPKRGPEGVRADARVDQAALAAAADASTEAKIFQGDVFVVLTDARSGELDCAAIRELVATRGGEVTGAAP